MAGCWEASASWEPGRVTLDAPRVRAMSSRRTCMGAI